MLELAGVGTWSLDTSKGRLTLSSASRRFYGLETSAVDVATWLAMIAPEDREIVRALWRGLLQGEGLHADLKIRALRPDGSVRWLSHRIDPRGAGLTPPRWSGVVWDVTAVHDAEMRRRRLIWELQERIKSLHGEVKTLSRRTVETSETLEYFEAHFSGRLSALAYVQTALCGPTYGVDLEEIVREQLRHGAGLEAERARVEGPPVRLRGRAAELMALAVHELVSNAVKFGALSIDTGALTVSWRRLAESGSAALAFVWEEAGVIVSAPEPEAGFGLDLLERGLAFELGAETHVLFRPEGVRCTIALPLTDVLAG